MENGAVSEKETNVDEVMTQFIIKFYTVGLSFIRWGQMFITRLHFDRNDSSKVKIWSWHLF